MRLAISTTETLTDLKTDLVVANNNNNKGWFLQRKLMLLFCVGIVLFEFRPEYYIENNLILHPTHVVDVRKGIRSKNAAGKGVL